MNKNFRGRKELEKILIELDKWNEKYNKSKDKYLTMSCVDGSWQGNNDFGRWGHIDFYITKEEMEELKNNLVL